MADEYENYDSGPFCRHWSDPSDCDIKCAKCNHKCIEHYFSDGDKDCTMCDCECWIEPNEEIENNEKTHPQT